MKDESIEWFANQESLVSKRVTYGITISSTNNMHVELIVFLAFQIEKQRV